MTSYFIGVVVEIIKIYQSQQLVCQFILDAKTDTKAYLLLNKQNTLIICAEVTLKM